MMESRNFFLIAIPGSLFFLHLSSELDRGASSSELSISESTVIAQMLLHKHEEPFDLNVDIRFMSCHFDVSVTSHITCNTPRPPCTNPSAVKAPTVARKDTTCTPQRVIPRHPMPSQIAGYNHKTIPCSTKYQHRSPIPSSSSPLTTTTPSQPCPPPTPNPQSPSYPSAPWASASHPSSSPTPTP